MWPDSQSLAVYHWQADLLRAEESGSAFDAYCTGKTAAEDARRKSRFGNSAEFDQAVEHDRARRAAPTGQSKFDTEENSPGAAQFAQAFGRKIEQVDQGELEDPGEDEGEEEKVDCGRSL